MLHCKIIGSLNIGGCELDLSGSEQGQVRAFVNMVIKLQVALNAEELQSFEEGCCPMEIDMAQHDTEMWFILMLFSAQGQNSVKLFSVLTSYVSQSIEAFDYVSSEAA